MHKTHLRGDDSSSSVSMPRWQMACIRLSVRFAIEDSVVHKLMGCYNFASADN